MAIKKCGCRICQAMYISLSYPAQPPRPPVEALLGMKSGKGLG